MTVLAVRFRSTYGREWTAVGGGPSVAAAIAAARDGLPGGTAWVAVSWDELFGA